MPPLLPWMMIGQPNDMFISNVGLFDSAVLTLIAGSLLLEVFFSCFFNLFYVRHSFGYPCLLGDSFGS
jgi:hypothetical protein